jgi:IclR family acetate operon transcriptional repressor
VTRPTSKALERSIDILEFIADGGSEGVSVSEVARASGTTKSNAYVILQTFIERGYVVDSGDGLTRRYRLGPMFLRMASATSAQQPMAQLVQSALVGVTQDLGMPSRFAVFEDGYAVALHKQEAQGPIQFASYLGRREMPHCSGIGKALLFLMDENRVREIVAATGLERRTEKTITDVERLIEDLRLSRERGYAFDDEEDNEGVFCVGAPVVGVGGQVAGAISVSGLKHGRSLDDMHDIGRRLVEKVTQLSWRLGG